MYGGLTMDGQGIDRKTVNGEVRRRIEALIVDYAHAIDDDRVEEWPEFFAEPCSYRIIDRHAFAKGRVVGVMECSSKGMMQDRVLALREANVYEPHVYRHLLSGTRIVGEEGGVYAVETSYTVIRTMQEGDAAIFSTGKYVDRIVLDNGAAKFRSRVVVCDSNRIDTLIVIPI